MEVYKMPFNVNEANTTCGVIKQHICVICLVKNSVS